MRLRVAGVNHNDVLGRDRLLAWLQKVCNEENSHPSFVAVEYNRSHFADIKSQRPLFRKLAAEVWPNSSKQVFDTIQDSLAYEGDLHELIFSGAETVWLDQGRLVDDPTRLSKYACDRLKIYRNFIKSERLALSPEDFSTMSNAAWKHREPPQPDDRDFKFAEVLLDRFIRDQTDWGIAIVGSDHASGVDGSMVNRLEGEGVVCQVKQLWPYDTSN